MDRMEPAYNRASVYDTLLATINGWYLPTNLVLADLLANIYGYGVCYRFCVSGLTGYHLCMVSAHQSCIRRRTRNCLPILYGQTYSLPHICVVYAYLSCTNRLTSYRICLVSTCHSRVSRLTSYLICTVSAYHYLVWTDLLATIYVWYMPSSLVWADLLAAIFVWYLHNNPVWADL